MFLHSLFQQVVVSLNDVQVSNSAETYAYRAYNESAMDPRLNPRSLPHHCITWTMPATWIVLSLTTLTQARRTMDWRNGRVYGQRRHRQHDWSHSFGYFLCQSQTREIQGFVCPLLGEANPTYKVKLISAVLLVRKSSAKLVGLYGSR